VGSTAPAWSLIVNAVSGAEQSAFFGRVGASGGDHMIVLNTDKVLNNRNFVLFNANTNSTNGGNGESWSYSGASTGYVGTKITQTSSSTLKSKMIFAVNTGNAKTEALTLNDDASATFAGNISVSGNISNDAGTLKIEGTRDSTLNIHQIGHGASGNGVGSAQPLDVVSIRGYSIEYPDQNVYTRLANVGFLHWFGSGSWTGNTRQWALTNGYNMGGGGGPRFALLFGNEVSDMPSLGASGGLGTNTNLACYWDKDGNFNQNKGATFAGIVSAVGRLQVTGNGTPTVTGGGIELGYTSSTGKILAIDRNGNAYKALELNGLSHSFKISGTEKFGIDSSGNATFAGTVGGVTNMATVTSDIDSSPTIYVDNDAPSGGVTGDIWLEY